MSFVESISGSSAPTSRSRAPASSSTTAERTSPTRTAIPTRWRRASGRSSPSRRASSPRDGRPLMAFGNKGGTTQPEAQAEHVINMVDLGMNVQATADARPIRPPVERLRRPRQRLDAPRRTAVDRSRPQGGDRAEPVRRLPGTPLRARPAAAGGAHATARHALLQGRAQNGPREKQALRVASQRRLPRRLGSATGRPREGW